MTIGDILDRLGLFIAAKARGLSKNRACAEIEISKGTVGTYQLRVSEAERHGIDLTEFRDYKWRDFRQVFRSTVMQSGILIEGDDNEIDPTSDRKAADRADALLEDGMRLAIPALSVGPRILSRLKVGLEPLRVLSSHVVYEYTPRTNRDSTRRRTRRKKRRRIDEDDEDDEESEEQIIENDDEESSQDDTPEEEEEQAEMTQEGESNDEEGSHRAGEARGPIVIYPPATPKLKVESVRRSSLVDAKENGSTGRSTPSSISGTVTRKRKEPPPIPYSPQPSVAHPLLTPVPSIAVQYPPVSMHASTLGPPAGPLPLPLSPPNPTIINPYTEHDN